MRSAVLTLSLLFLTAFPAAAQNDAAVPQTQAQIKLSFAPLVKKVAPAVVNIYTKRKVATGFQNPFMNDPFFGQFFHNDMFGGPMRDQIEGALGSGVIIQENGLVVTNSHVVRGADVITIGLADGREFDAALVVSDDASDLSLLRVKDQNLKLPFVTLKPSESLEVGDLVLAIGNPFGVGQTVTSGIVSAQGRSSLDINDYNFFIQTDAAINPGNSGGPLVDMDGNVVGINTAIYSRSGGSMGIGFAVPSEMVASVVAAEESGQVTASGIVRPWFGIGAQDVTADIAASLGLDHPNGALISALHPSSPFNKAGLKIGDVVSAINGKAIRDSSELKFRAAMIPMGQSAKVSVLRNGKILDFEMTAIAPPDDPPRAEATLKGEHILKGVVVANLNPAVAVELGLKDDSQGIVVMKVPRGTAASRFIAPGDLLRQVNGVEIKKPADVEKAFDDKEQQGFVLVVERNGRINQIMVR